MRYASLSILMTTAAFASIAACSSTSASPRRPEDSGLDSTITLDGAAEASAESSTRDGATAEAGDAAADAAALSDGQIVGYLLAANTGEIEQADLALGTSPDAGNVGLDAGDAGVDAFVALDASSARYADTRVGRFAQMMIADHTAANEAVKGLGIPAASSPAQASLQTTVSASLAQLSPLSGAAFDVAYLEAQVSAHTAVRDAIDAMLVPDATSPQLKTLLSTGVLPVVESHLASATALLAELTDGGSVDAGRDAGDATTE